MSQETIEQTPALTASQASWRCVQAKDKDGWLALMADDVVIEDPIGPAVHQPRRHRRRGKDGVSQFWDNEHRPCHHPDHLRGDLPVEFARRDRPYPAVALHVRQRLGERGARGVHLRVNDVGLLTNLRGYWNMDMMKPVKEGEGD